MTYHTYGSSPTLLLLHGFAEDSSVWDGQVKFLCDHFRLIVPDLPGTGNSPLIDKENVSLTDYADYIKAIIDKEKAEKFTMIGHSMGGYITLAFAEKYPDKLNAFFLFHSSAFADDAEKIATRRKGIAFIYENGPEAFLKATIPGLFYDTIKSKEYIDDLTKRAGQFSSAALIQYYEAMIARPDRTEVLKKLTIPAGFILGENDKAVPFQQGLKQTHLPQLSFIYILRKSAHMGMKEEREKVNDCLSKFLSVTIS